jgi:hypothetical protein
MSLPVDPNATTEIKIGDILLSHGLLLEALKRFGAHLPACRSWNHFKGEVLPSCTCGLSAALKAAEER